MYVPWMLLDERTIEFIFKMETTKSFTWGRFVPSLQFWEYASILYLTKTWKSKCPIGFEQSCLAERLLKQWNHPCVHMITHNWIPNNFVAVVPIDDLENDEEEHVEFQHEESTYHVKDTFKTEEKVETNIHIHVPRKCLPKLLISWPSGQGFLC